jgi:hypothetical protein
MRAPESQDTRAMQVEATDFLVDLADVNRTKIRSSRCSTTEGNVLVKVRQFAFTANNMTYALIGGATGWIFFQRHGDGAGFPFGDLAKSSLRKSAIWKLVKNYSVTFRCRRTFS